ncbi:hypothetical protein [Acinetobacter sp. P1(2025)]|uniref:hypothetical protein n=1 Tax=Acinetobacter sp. P1(2025) TaxID=3446120 RepID=UPI003F531989
MKNLLANLTTEDSIVFGIFLALVISPFFFFGLKLAIVGCLLFIVFMAIGSWDLEVGAIVLFMAMFLIGTPFVAFKLIDVFSDIDTGIAITYKWLSYLFLAFGVFFPVVLIPDLIRRIKDRISLEDSSQD